MVTSSIGLFAIDSRRDRWESLGSESIGPCGTELGYSCSKSICSAVIAEDAGHQLVEVYLHDDGRDERSFHNCMGTVTSDDVALGTLIRWGVEFRNTRHTYVGLGTRLPNGTPL